MEFGIENCSTLVMKSGNGLMTEESIYQIKWSERSGWKEKKTYKY